MRWRRSKYHQFRASSSLDRLVHWVSEEGSRPDKSCERPTHNSRGPAECKLIQGWLPIQYSARSFGKCSCTTPILSLEKSPLLAKMYHTADGDLDLASRCCQSVRLAFLQALSHPRDGSAPAGTDPNTKRVWVIPESNLSTVHS